MSDKRRTYLIQDPYDLDAIEFIKTMDLKYGLRPVCFYTDAKAKYYGQQQFPILTSDIIEANYDVSLDDLASFAETVRHHYEVVAVVPYLENTVEVAATLCGLLDLGWNSEATMQRFRDKHELKVHVSRRDPSVRVPVHRLVRGIDDLSEGPIPNRFVLKPNNGYGNWAIGIFDRSEFDAASRHITDHPGVTWIMEEFISGPEFHLDGHVRTGGVFTPLVLMEYIRTQANGYDTVYVAERQCHTDHPLWDPIVDYARRLLAATGLQRCPFHLEVKVDDLGPCLIDLGARFPSEGGARTMSRLHRDRPTAFEVASADYLGPNDFAIGPVDWSYYNSQQTLLVYGISTREDMIQTLAGIDEIERMPEFVGWAVKPKLGDRLVPTCDLRGAPYIVELCHDRNDVETAELIEKVQRTIRWNENVSVGEQLRAKTLDVAGRIYRRLRWSAHHLLTRSTNWFPTRAHSAK